MSPRRVLVTGGSGFVGRRVLPALASAEWLPVALVRTDRSADEVAEMGGEPLRGDLGTPDLPDVFRRASADVLLNIASLGFGHAPGIVNAAQAASIRHAVFVSTTAILTNLNAASKATRVAAEDTIRSSGLHATIVRPTMIYGGVDDRNVSRLLRLLRWVPVLPLPGGGSALQQPVHVNDVADALVALLDRPDLAGRTYSLGGREPLSLADLIHESATAMCTRTRTVSVPLGPVLAVARRYQRCSQNPRLKAEQFERLAEHKAFDISDAVNDFGYCPRAFPVGVRDEAEELMATNRRR